MPEYTVLDVCLRSWHIFEAVVHDLLERLEEDVDRLEGLEEERVDGARPVAAADLEAAGARPLAEAAGAVVLDDFDRALEGEPRLDEAALLHLHNALAEAGGHLLLTAGAAPARWDLRLPDLASRLRAAPAVAVTAPDDALMTAVLVKLFADRQLRVGQGVVEFLVRRIERSFEAARDIVAAIDAGALAAHRNVTVPLAREVLGRRELET